METRAEHAHAVVPTLPGDCRRATLLVLQLGPWDFEDGCIDLHSLHDSLCNNTRPLILQDFTKRWSLIASALNAAYARPEQKARSMVVLRAETPRDFDGGQWKQGGYCRRKEPYERLTGLTPHSVDGFDESTGLDPASMRFVVTT